MSEPTPEIAADVVTACQAGAEEAAGALGRSLDGQFELTVGEASPYIADGAPQGFDGPGLAMLLKIGDVGFAALLPEASGLLPAWYADPDPTGESKLSTLAQELSMLLLPETLIADAFAAARVENLGAALSAAGVANDAALVPIELTAGESQGQLSLVWPLALADGLLPQSKVAPEPAPSAARKTASAPAGPVAGTTGTLDFSHLPSYSRSLLRISLPVSVKLASKKENLQDVTELAAGTIIKFDKACDEMLELFVGAQAVAQGEAVKIGDKFGFRVSAMLLPDERFMKVRPNHAG
jgi:flagellar motor switch protein FliN/FliY